MRVIRGIAHIFFIITIWILFNGQIDPCSGECDYNSLCQENQGGCLVDDYKCAESLVCRNNVCIKGTSTIPQGTEARSSSVLDKAVHLRGPDFAIDGKLSSEFTRYFLTKSEDYPWIEITLPSAMTISSVTMVHKTRSAGTRLKNVEIRTGMTRITAATTYHLLIINTVCGVYLGPRETGEHSTINCASPILAKYITIQKKDNGYLHLDEVMLYQQRGIGEPACENCFPECNTISNERIHVCQCGSNRCRAATMCMHDECLPECRFRSGGPKIKCICGGRICQSSCIDGKCIEVCGGERVQQPGCLCGISKCVNMFCVQQLCLPRCLSSESPPAGVPCACGTEACHTGNRCVNSKCLIECAPDARIETTCACGENADKCTVGNWCFGNKCLKDCTTDVIITGDDCSCSGTHCYPSHRCMQNKCIEDCNQYEVTSSENTIMTKDCRCGQTFCEKGRVCNSNGCTIQSTPYWCPWSQWSGCSHTCGRGTRQKKRECACPNPIGVNQMCMGGNDTVRQTCKLGECACKNSRAIHDNSGCSCNGMICEKGHICKQKKCLTECERYPIRDKLCMCGENFCIPPHKCLMGECVTRCPQNIVLKEKCSCGVAGLATMCKEGQMCYATKCRRVCPDDELQVLIDCICTNQMCYVGMKCDYEMGKRECDEDASILVRKGAEKGMATYNSPKGYSVLYIAMVLVIMFYPKYIMSI